MSRRACRSLVSQIAAAVRSSASAAGPSASPRMGAALLAEAAAAAQQQSAWAVLAAARCVSMSAAPRMSNLLNVLKEELKHEKEGYTKPEEIASGPPAPFTLSESSEGDTLLTLRRTYNGEEVCIDLHVNNQPAQDFAEESNQNEEGETLSLVTFNVTVTKGDKSLVFECESDGTFVSITHVSHEPKDGQPSESNYTGPVFNELDETLQTELQQYLQERGITVELGEYLRHLIYDKEQREYMNWLDSVHKFVSK